MLMSALPIFGEPMQFVSDVNRYGAATAADRAAYIQYHPAHFASGPVAALLGVATAPLLAKKRSLRKLYEPINKILLGNGPHKIAPAVGIGLANTAAFGLLGNYTARGLISREYTKKEAKFGFNMPNSEEEKAEKFTRTATGLSTTIPLMASRLYAANMPLYTDLDAVKSMDPITADRAHKRMRNSASKRNIVFTSERLNDVLSNATERRSIGSALGLDFGDALAPPSAHAKNLAERVGVIMRLLNNTPGAYLDNDSPLSKSLASNLYSDKEVKNIKGMIFGSTSDASILQRLVGGGATTGSAPALHVAAHEMGHATQPKWMKHTFARAGLAGPVAAIAAPVLSDDESLSLGAAGLGTAAAAPGLIGEYDASKRGVGFLKNWVGKKNFGKLSAPAKLAPFVGLPTYLAAATMPWVAYGTKKLLGGYDKENK
jgi:hypothetical protein